MNNIDTSKIQIPESFVNLSKKIYPEQIFLHDKKDEIDFLFSSHNPFFNSGSASYKIIENKFRVAVFFEPGNKYKEKQVAYFGYWETINDLQLNQESFLECETWAKERGAELLIGPINFNTYNRYRLNTSINCNSSFLNEPFNPSYYPQILESCGFTVLTEYVSYVVKDKNKIRQWYEIYDKKKDLLTFDDYTFKNITPQLWMERIEEIHKMSEIVFGDNFAYSPIDLATFKVKYGTVFSHFICSNTSLFAFDKDDKIIGTIINFPNYQTATPTLKPKTLLLKTVGMVKEHSHMGYLLIAMLLKIIPNALEQYDDFIFCLMRKGNYPSLLGAEFSDFTKTYSLYVKEI